MDIILFFLLCNIVVHQAQDFGEISESSAYVAPSDQKKGENPLKEAVRLLQFQTLRTLQKKLAQLNIENEQNKKEKLLLEQNFERLKKEKEEEIRITKKRYEEKIEQMREEYEEKYEKINTCNEEKEQIKNITAEYEENENMLNIKLESKQSMLDYIVGVLEENAKLIDFWQNTVTQQANEINNKIEENMNLTKIVLESKHIMQTQDETIEQLEQLVLNNQNLTESYRNIVENDPTKNNCEIPTWVNSLTISWKAQNTQINTISDYIKNNQEMHQYIKALENLLPNYNKTESENQTNLLSHYHELFEQQSTSLLLMRKIVTDKLNFSTCLNYEEDNNGFLISVTPLDFRLSSTKTASTTSTTTTTTTKATTTTTTNTTLTITTTTTATTTTTTTTTTTIKTISLIQLSNGAMAKLYYKENGSEYYGIPVAKGRRLVSGVVTDTCEAAGMRAVCVGNSNCSLNGKGCKVVNFETAAEDCGSSMKGLSKKLCNGKKPDKCTQLDGLFTEYKRKEDSGAVGLVNGSWYVWGRDYTSGEPTVYYAYCVKE